MSEQQQKKNKQVAAFSSLGIHAVLFILMFFIIAWVPPDPPLGANGVSLNIGLDLEGSGDYQPETVGNEGKSQDEAAKSDAQSPPQQESKEETVKEDDTKQTDETAVDKSESQIESPVTVNPEKKETVKPAADKSPVKSNDKPAEVKQQVNPNAVFDPNAKKSNTDKTGEGKAGQAGNEGDDKGKTGDKGDPRGVKEGTVYQGNPGKGGDGPGGDGGFGLSMSGWTWDEKPNAPKVEDNENGFVVFRITVDDQGEIISATPIEQTLSAETVRRCKAKIMERSFVRTAGGSVPKESTGTVRFELRVK
jgi:periplasmic protein TonB